MPTVRDVQSGRQVSELFKGHLNLISFCSDSKLDQTIRVFNVHTGEFVAELFHHAHGVESIAFSPDGKYVVSGDEIGMVQVLDAQTGEVVVGPFKGHTAHQSLFTQRQVQHLRVL
jgi:WD40 repeat protein